MLRFAPASSRLNILCLGAHPDDIEIGAGGALLTLARRGDLVINRLILTGTPDRIREANYAAELFGGGNVAFGGLPDGRLPAHWASVKEFLEEKASRLERPDLIFAPRSQDAHQDHALVGSLVPTVWRDSTVLHYEIPKWDGDLSPMSHFIGLLPEIADRKYELLTKAYPSQLSHDWWDRDMFLGLMRLRGMECRAAFAEGFVSNKIIIDLEPAVPHV